MPFITRKSGNYFRLKPALTTIYITPFDILFELVCATYQGKKKTKNQNQRNPQNLNPTYLLIFLQFRDSFGNSPCEYLLSLLPPSVRLIVKFPSSFRQQAWYNCIWKVCEEGKKSSVFVRGCKETSVTPPNRDWQIGQALNLYWALDIFQIWNFSHTLVTHL